MPWNGRLLQQVRERVAWLVIANLFFSFYKIVLKIIEWIRILCTHDYVIKDN